MTQPMSAIMTSDRFFDACILLAGSSNRETHLLDVWVAALGHRFTRGETPTIVTTGCCHHSLDIFPGRTEAQIARDLLIEFGIPSSNILCEEESGDLLGRLVHTRDGILEPCGWFHVELLLPGADDRDLRNIQHVLGPDYILTLTSLDAPTSETTSEELEAFRATMSRVVDSLDRQDLNSLIRSPKAKGRPQNS